MAVFRKIFRCFLGCNKEEEGLRRRNRNRSGTYLDGHGGVRHLDTSKTSIAALNSTIYNDLIRQSDAPSSSRKLPETSISPNLPQTLTAPFVVRPKLTVESEVSRRTPDISHEVPQKQKISPPSSSKTRVTHEGTTPIYATPKDLKDLFRRNVVPGVLKKPLSPSTYKDYFDALLYAEDFYLEKWDGVEMQNVTLKLHEAGICQNKGKRDNRNVYDEKEGKVFVEFEMDSIYERRPFLFSRDFLFVRPSGNTVVDPFQSNLVLVEFGEDFHCQHYSTSNYDVKFSFNRVCLKRAHQAIAAASNPSFRNFLFPDSLPKNSLVAAQLRPVDPRLDQEQVSAVHQILSHQNAPPYLVEGPSTVNTAHQLSRTGLVVCEAILQIYRMHPSCRILVCAPINSTCDVITRDLKKEIPESDMFRANAAFRELDGVPVDIIPTCRYNRECFACPSIQTLQRFKVILSTFMSSFRLHDEGIVAGHFSHIFLVDTSSATEPETMVALANMANEETAVTMTGSRGNHSRWIRSDIARKNGLITSYFERLRDRKLYKSLDSRVITQL